MVEKYFQILYPVSDGAGAAFPQPQPLKMPVVEKVKSLRTAARVPPRPKHRKILNNQATKQPRKTAFVASFLRCSIPSPSKIIQFFLSVFPFCGHVYV
jgi:hypothetical protein